MRKVSRKRRAKSVERRRTRNQGIVYHGFVMKKMPITILLILLVMGGWYLWGIGGGGASEMRSVVSIPQGSSLQSIAMILEEKQVIRSARAFRFYTWWRGKSGSLQAGTFVMPAGAGAKSALEILTTGKSREMVVTIVEGMTVADIDRLLAEKELAKEWTTIGCARSCDFSRFGFLPPASPSFLNPLEGFLFPDTYFVIAQNFSVEDFLGRLLETFKQRVPEGLAKDLAGTSRSLHEVVTMASILEKESRLGEERAVVSGILWKRFDEKRGLDADATVRYIVGKDTEALTTADLRIDSPYNTRRYRGLPPGPIANPGISAIRAALLPTPSPYYYYLHDPAGVIHYASTNDEHNVNKAIYLR